MEQPRRGLLAFESWDPDEAARRREKNDAEVDAKLAELGAAKAGDAHVLRGPFPYADLRLETKTTSDETARTVTLWFGASSSGRAAVYPMHVTLGPHPAWSSTDDDETVTMGEPSLAYANVTRDGSEIGIVVLASGAMWYEEGGTARMPTAAFVAAVRSAK